MTHIISRAKDFNFIHIPKNGGSTIRHTYLPFDDCGQKFAFSIVEDNKFGTIAQGHLPLWVIQQSYPAEFEMIRNGWSCAITRDPMDRFRSAMEQRAREFLGVKLGELTLDQLRRELNKVVEHMTANPDLPQADFCHFARQRDFIFLGEVQIVENVYPLERIKELLAELARRTGVEAGETRVNASEVKPRGGYTRILKAGWKAVKPVLPIDIQNRLRRQLRPLVSARSEMEDDEVVSFVREFYADDFKLHAEASGLAASN